MAVILRQMGMEFQGGWFCWKEGAAILGRLPATEATRCHASPPDGEATPHAFMKAIRKTKMQHALIYFEAASDVHAFINDGLCIPLSLVLYRIYAPSRAYAAYCQNAIRLYRQVSLCARQEALSAFSANFERWCTKYLPADIDGLYLLVYIKLSRSPWVT